MTIARNEVDGTGGAIVGAGVGVGTALLLEGRRIEFNSGQRFQFELAAALPIALEPVEPTPGPRGLEGLWWALGVHALLTAAAILYILRQVRRAIWPPPPRSKPVMIFRLLCLIVHALVIAPGTWVFEWPWLPGAAAAILLGHLVYLQLRLAGFFAPPGMTAPATAPPMPPPLPPS